ncbi:alkane 1-monooxygenase [Halocynthiibacter styelae]|uniref:Alkane 1-monooxygenase n=1 Tax=Halocynthiibacter styelae TaxID=2761955 RepID=A0A8J7LLL9_9RHOB|nr:alkane 1-monooxygenase [Paenihalocynthiibacter styelae]MBI1494769.1 alkane 1-monooxygenase [Paenihalocynthiibacter styelae]
MLFTPNVSQFTKALPFWMSLLTVPVALLGAIHGDWTVYLMPLFAWYFFSILDAFTGLNLENADPETGEADLFWYRLITMIWFPVQFVTGFFVLWYVTHTDHHSVWEMIVLFFGMGVMCGSVGIVYAHELMHQKNRLERTLGDLLLAMVMYSHFRSEHLLVHHRYVGTPRDTVTARYNEGFHRFFMRVLFESVRSAWQAEAAMLERKNLPKGHASNPFYRYWAIQGGMLLLAVLLGGFWGLLLFLWQAYIAIWQLELTNYVEHYGLTRKHLGNGKYEHVKPHHSWNASHKATNWLLINLQRHSDHHYKPDRRFPLLQNYEEDQAPQLPYGYPLMAVAAMIPPVWRRIMNPRVGAWREKYYPEIKSWLAYKNGTNPMPR